SIRSRRLRLVVEKDFPSAWREHQPQHVEEGGFPTPRRTGECSDFPRGELKAQAIKKFLRVLGVFEPQITNAEDAHRASLFAARTCTEVPSSRPSTMTIPCPLATTSTGTGPFSVTTSVSP